MLDAISITVPARQDIFVANPQFGAGTRPAATEYRLDAGPQPKFGIDLGTILNGAITAAAQQHTPTNTPKRQSRLNNKRFRRFVRVNLVATPALTLALMNIAPMVSLARQADNHLLHATPLTSVLATSPTPDLVKNPVKDPQKDPILPPQKLIDIAQHRADTTLPPSTLLEYAKAKMLKEVLAGPTDTLGTAVLINGQELSTALDAPTRKALVETYDLNVHPPFLNGLQLNFVTAALIASLAVNLLASRKPTRLTDETLTKMDKERYATNEMARFLVAYKLGVTDEALILEDVTSQKDVPWLLPNRRSLTIDEIQKRLAVLFSGLVAEEILYGENGLRTLESPAPAVETPEPFKPNGWRVTQAPDGSLTIITLDPETLQPKALSTVETTEIGETSDTKTDVETAEDTNSGTSYNRRLTVTTKYVESLVSRIADELCAGIDGTDVFDLYIPQDPSEDEKAAIKVHAKAMVLEARQTAVDVLTAYPPEHLVMLRDALQKHNRLRPKEIDAILEHGKPLTFFQRSRHRVNATLNVKQRVRNRRKRDEH